MKTLTDPGAKDVSFTPKRTTIDALRAEAVPMPMIGKATPRIGGVEQTTYKVRATLVEARLVPDEDYHLVVADAQGHTMIVEFPDVRCPPAASSRKKVAMREARQAFLDACDKIGTRFVRLRGTATITGVGFFDKKHNQLGGAPNAIELHPVLSFTRATCERR